LNWVIEYYQKENGEIPVEDFLLTLQPKLRAKAYSDIMLLKRLGINIRAPYSSPVKGDRYKGIFELRTKFSSDITRILYFLFEKNKFVLLHGFVKKGNKPPERELERGYRPYENISVKSIKTILLLAFFLAVAVKPLLEKK